MIYLLQAISLLSVISLPLVYYATRHSEVEETYWELFKHQCFLARLSDAGEWARFGTARYRIYEEVYGETPW